MAVTTLMDIAIANGSDPVVGLVEEVIKAHPELEVGAARTIQGINYKTLVRTALPTVGFRSGNSGSPLGKGVYENRLFECFILNPQWEADKAIADAYEDGAAAWLALEASGQMEAAMITLGKQFYYGANATFGDVLGNPGLLDALDSSMTEDATGTTDNVATSVWGVRFGPRDVQWLWGNNGSLALSPVTEQRVLDGSSNPYLAYHQEILARPGLQVVNKYSVGRIKKITTDSGKGLTDALISKFLARWPAGRGPDVLFMSRRSLQQLQASRTATTVTGAPAPFPTESFGVPIKVTDSISEIETLAL